MVRMIPSPAAKVHAALLVGSRGHTYERHIEYAVVFPS